MLQYVMLLPNLETTRNSQKNSVQEVSQSSLQNMAAATFLNNVALIMCPVTTTLLRYSPRSYLPPKICFSEWAVLMVVSLTLVVCIRLRRLRALSTTR